MEIKKANDMLVATINNPNATTYDLMSLQLTPDNTGLLTKDEYKESKYIQDRFTTSDGVFDDISFDNAFLAAAYHYKEMTDDEYIKSLSEIKYSPFDITRPASAKTFNVSVEFSKDYNPFKQTYSRTGINSVDENKFSLRELAQQSKVFDPETQEWSEKAANDLSFIDKFFGDTLVYAQWDEDGTHIDVETGREINHVKGDWKVNEDGNLFLEKLGKREIYGKQIVNPMDMLTTDGSIANNFDFFDSDDREKSILKTTLKLAADIAPLLIPGFNTFYAGVKAALSLAAVMPTFYKSFEGLLLGENTTSATHVATAAEGYMSKFTAKSTSDYAQGSFFNYEQMSSLVASIFSQIYEQRAMASLSKYIVKNPVNIADVEKKFLKEINKNIIDSMVSGKINPNNIEEIMAIKTAALSKLPKLKAFQQTQSALAKSLSLGYMALTSTSDVYSEALAGGYDRRVAGFASIAAAAGQYGVMMNNRMGDWFLDKTTGYTVETNKAMVRKSIKEYFPEIEAAFQSKTATEAKFKLSTVFKNFKHKMFDVFTSPTELGEAVFKKAFIEGIEEVTEEVVEDATKGVIDLFSYLGLIDKPGSFGGFDNAFSKDGFERYMSNFVGGILGGAMFELNTGKLEPLLNREALTKTTKEDLYRLIANGNTDLIISQLNKNRYKLGNKYLSVESNQENVPQSAKEGFSQADAIVDNSINIVKNIDGVMNQMGLKNTDNDIIKKAMLEHLIVKDLNDSKNESKIGIEAIVIDDLTTARSKILEIKNNIDILSTNKEDIEKNKDEIKRLREESKPYEKTLSDIYEGKNAERYYNQMMFYLSKLVSKDWVLLDKDNFTRTKYGVEYSTLPQKSFSLSKEKLDTEWSEYTNSTDLRKNIAVATDAYLEAEGELNFALTDYMESGYSAERSKTFNLAIDLENTIKMFNTADPEKQKNILERFKYISTELKELGKSKLNIAPWNVYVQDIGTKLLKFGMVGKASTDEEGNVLADPTTGEVIGTPFTEEELNAVNEQGIVFKDMLAQQVSMLFSEVPIDPLEMEASIKILNAMIVSNNNQNKKEVLNLIQKAEQTTENKEKIEQLQSNMYNFVLLSYNNTNDVVNKKAEIDIEIKNIYNRLNAEIGVEADIISAYKSNRYYDFSNDLLKDEQNILKWLIDMDSSEITEDFIETLTEQQITQFENSSLNSKVNQEKNLYNRLIEAKSYIESGKVIDTHQDKFEEVINEEADIYSNFQNEVDATKPEILKMRNYGLDILLDFIKDTGNNSPSKDAEIINEVKIMISNITKGYNSEFFPNIKFDSISDLIHLINNASEIAKEIETSDALTVVIDITDEGTDIVANEYSKEKITEANFDKIITKYLTNDNTYNESLLDGIIKVSKVKHSLSGLDQVNSFLELDRTRPTAIENPLYKILKNLALSLQTRGNSKMPTVFEVLDNETKSIIAASDINNYLSEGVKLNDLREAINLITLIQSVVQGTSTTEIDFEDPYGFIKSRQDFLVRNEIESKVREYKTISSDLANLMINDLNQIKTKLQFFLDLSKSNAEKTINEQENIRSEMTKILYNKLKEISNLSPFTNIKAKFDDIDKDVNTSQEKKLLELETIIFEEFKDANKIDILKEIFKDINIKIDPRKLTLLTKDIKQEDVKDFDFSIYLSTIMSVSSKDFNSKLHTLIESFDKAPFFTQELAMRIAYASLVEPELFSSIIDFDNTSTEKNTTDLITYILGNSGSGKTTVVFKLLLKYIQRNNKSLNVWFVGPAESQAIKLEKDVLTNVEFSGDKQIYDKFKLYNSIGIGSEMMEIVEDLQNGNDESKYYTWTKESNPRIYLNEDVMNDFLSKAFKDVDGNINQNLPNLIFIDEISHFSSLELEILNTLVKSLPKENRIKIIAAGDISQSGFKYGKNQNAFDLSIDRVKGIFSPKLIVSIRSANSWKRENNDTTYTLSERVTDIYHDENISDLDKSKKVEELINIYKNQNLFNLKYFKDDTNLHGDIIENTLSDTILITLKNSLNSEEGKNKIIGILTEDGNLEEYRTVLNKAGFVGKDGNIDPRIKGFSLKSIQGNETDYFIFNTKLIKSEASHHKLKDFYTYMSRAKDASVIIDNGGVFTNEFSITNIVQNNTSRRTPLSEQQIKESREKRISILAALLDNKFDVKYDNFTFGDSKVELEEIVNSVLKEEDLTTTVFDQQESVGTVADDFNYMFHTFYNNPNVETKPIFDDKNNIVGRELIGINYNEHNGNSDLNIENNIRDKETLDNIVEGWLSIKNDYTYEKKLPSNSKSDAYLKLLFGDSITANKIQTSTVLTATVYNETIHGPLFKQGFTTDKTLKNGDIFINVSLKLKSNTKVHYVTLASISANTIDSAFGPDSKSAELYDDVIFKITEDFKNKETPTILELTDVDFSNQITSLRFLKNLTVETSVKDILKKYPGIKRSDILFYPTNKIAFVELVNSYSFGEKRKSEDTIKIENGEKKVTSGLDSLYEKYKGKPYIALSYGSDLKGSNSSDVQAKITPLITKNRTYEQTVKDINDLRSIYFKALDANTSDNDLKKISRTFKNLVSTTQLIDLLIDVAKEYPDSFDGMLTKLGTFNKRPLEYINKVGNKNNKEEIKNDILNLFEKIQKLRKKEKDVIKTELRDLMGNNNWKNYASNIFILDSFIESEFKNSTEDDVKKILEEMKEKVLDFNNALKSVSAKTGIYWETAKNKEKAVSSFRENSTNEIEIEIERFQPENYLFFKRVPESPRFLLNLENAFNKIINNVSTESKKPKQKLKVTTKKVVNNTSKTEIKQGVVASNEPNTTNINKFSSTLNSLSKTDTSDVLKFAILNLFDNFTDSEIELAEKNIASGESYSDWILSEFQKPKEISLTFDMFMKELATKINPNADHTKLTLNIFRIANEFAKIYNLDSQVIKKSLERIRDLC